MVQDEKKRFKCVKCRESGHHKDECQKGWKCLKCDEFGHKAVDCSENETDSEDDRENMEHVEKENGREAVETINKNYVRRVRMNMMKKIDNEDSLMVVEGKLQGAYLKFVMFDTGSEISILAKRVAKANHFLIKRVNTIIELPDGRQVNALGETETLIFEVMGYYTNMSFTVTEMDEYDMLIGLDFSTRRN